MPSRLPNLRPTANSADEAIAFYKQCAIYWRNAYIREITSLSRMAQQITELKQAINRVETYFSLGLRSSNMDHEGPLYDNVNADYSRPDIRAYPSSSVGGQKSASPESDAGNTTEFETDDDNDNDGIDDKDSGLGTDEH